MIAPATRNGYPTSPGLDPAAAVDPSAGLTPPPSPSPLPGRELIMVASASDLDAREEYERQQTQEPAKAAFTNLLSQHVCSLYHKAVRARQESGVDDALMRAMRQRKGEYEPDRLAEIREMGGSEIYTLFTEVKCLAAEAWIFETLMPSDEKPWSLAPTPMPELPEEEVNRIIEQTVMAAIQDSQTGQIPDPEAIYDYAKQMREKRMTQLREIAKQRAERMEQVMDDQLKEGGFAEAFDLFTSDLVTFGTGIMKGPVLRRSPKRQWGEGGRLIMAESLDYRVEHVSPLDFYPSPDAVEVEDGWHCQRIRMTVRQIQTMKGTPGADDAAIGWVCSQFGERGWHREIYTDTERKRLEDKSQTQSDTTIEGFEFHGPIMGSMLKLWADEKTLATMGYPSVDVTAEYEVCVTVLADVAIRIKANISPLADRPYSKVNFIRIIGSFWGRGIPDSMRDIQDVCNATARSLVNNMAIASGPQVMINDVGRLADGEAVTRMFPWKLWQFKNPAGHTAAPIQFFNPNSNANELMAIFDKFMAMADERTMIPAYAYGNDRAAGAGKTATGLSMLMSAASRSIKKVISMIDLRGIRPLITRLYDLNMIFHPDDSIKGDAQIIARGAIALMLREAQQAALAGFVQQVSGNQADMALIGPERRMNALRELARPIAAVPVDDLVPTKDEVREQMEAMAAAALAQQTTTPGGQPAPAQPAGA